jgi:hypothetical protein
MKISLIAQVMNFTVTEIANHLVTFATEELTALNLELMSNIVIVK